MRVAVERYLYLIIAGNLVLGIIIGRLSISPPNQEDPVDGAFIIGQPRSGVVASEPVDLPGKTILVPAGRVGVITAPLPGGESVAIIAQIRQTEAGLQISVPGWEGGPPKFPATNVLGRR